MHHFDAAGAMLCMLIFAFPGLALLRAAGSRRNRALQSLFAVIGSLLIMVAMGNFLGGFFFSMWDGDWAMITGFCGELLLLYIVFRPRTPAAPRIGYCAQCDYNLTGNISGICPECGLKIAELQQSPIAT